MAELTDIGTGTTLTFSGFVAEIKKIGISGISREIFETSHLGTTVAGAGEIGSKTFLPGDISDPGEISLEGHLDPSVTPPIEGAAATLTITFPSGTTWAGSAAMTNYDIDVGVEEVMTFSASFKFSGPITVTPAT